MSPQSKFDIEVSIDDASLKEFSVLPKARIAQFLFSKLTGTISFASRGQSLSPQIAEKLRTFAKLDPRGFHGIVCLEFLSDIARATRALARGRYSEEVDLTSSRYIVILERDGEEVTISVQDENGSTFTLEKARVNQLRKAVVRAADLVLDRLRQIRPEIDETNTIRAFLDSLNAIR